MSGIGDDNLRMFLFRSCRSTTTRKRVGVPGFGINNIGHVLRAVVASHHPDFRYEFFFSIHSGLKGSGHFEGRHG